ncbi:unnamed protein product [Ectocarpus sp. 12 AP-2014]
MPCKKPEFCGRHCQDDRMIDMKKNARCGHEGCGKVASFGVAGSKKREFCAPHAPRSVVDLVNDTRCGHTGCPKHPSYGVEGSKNTQFCSAHAPSGMANIRSKRCSHQGCTKQPSYGAPGTKKAEFCLAHASPAMVNVFSKRCAHPGCKRVRSMAETATRGPRSAANTVFQEWSLSVVGYAVTRAAGRNRPMRPQAPNEVSSARGTLRRG